MAAYRPHPKQVEAHVDQHKRKLLFWGRQVGKTMWSVQHAWLSAVQRQGRYFVVYRTYKQAKDVVWKQYISMIPKELRAKTNDTELSVTFPYLKGEIIMPWGEKIQLQHDDSRPPSSIQLLGSDEADSHRGMYAHGIIFDEYAKQNHENWSAVYEPMFSTTNGWAVFMSTPLGYNHWYDMVEYAKNNPEVWFYSEATWRDNPAVTEEFIKSARREADATGTMSTFLQEYELEFRTIEGAVFPEFDRKVHVVKPDDPYIPLPENGTDYVTIDFGYVEGHPTAINFVRLNSEGDWFVWDEIHVTHTQIDDIIAMIRQRMADIRVTAIIGDCARPDLIEYMQSKGLPVVPSPKGANSITSGIILLHQKLKPRLQLLGAPRPSLFITSNCKYTIQDFEQYKYPEAKKDRPVSDLPVKMNDDHCDGLRYLALHLKLGIVKSNRPIPRPKFNQFGMPL